ncbi:testis-expressed protein 50 [Manis javanica]|uniref:testis-expressed protein 50 n=1 Tax=Manis javanica TaxID=9974 RepID=UPI003C6D3CAE
MSIQGLSLIFPLLFFCFFGESLCISDGIIWRRIGWEILPEEMSSLKFELPQLYCLPYTLGKLCYDFADMDTFQTFLKLCFVLIQALIFILSVLSAHYLWMKWKKYKEKLEEQASSAHRNVLKSICIQETDQMLYKVVVTESMIKNYLNQMSCHLPAKKFKCRKLKKRGKR